MEFLKKHGLDRDLGGVFQKKMLCQRLWGRVSLEHYKNTVALEAFPCRSEFAQLLGYIKIINQKPPAKPVVCQDLGGRSKRPGGIMSRSKRLSIAKFGRSSLSLQFFQADVF